jgi:hypothetical protein
MPCINKPVVHCGSFVTDLTIKFIIEVEKSKLGTLNSVFGQLVV